MSNAHVEDQQIYDSARCCDSLFQQLSTQLVKGQAKHYAIVRDLHLRFNQWVDFVGALADEQASLDSRLRPHHEVRDLVFQILDMLDTSLHYALHSETENPATIGSADPPTPGAPEDENRSQLKMDMPTVAAETSPEQLAQEVRPRQLSVSRTALNAIRDAIDRLHRVATIIRRSSTSSSASRVKDFSLKTDAVENAEFERLMLLRLKGLLPNASDSLVRQLVASVSYRRFRLMYQRRHQRKLGKRRPDPSPQNLLSAPPEKKRVPVAPVRHLTPDASRASSEADSATRPRAYSSPPMSGSPPLHPKSSQGADERSQGIYHTTSQDAHRGISATHGDFRLQQLGIPPQPQARAPPQGPAPMRPFPPDSLERVPYGYHRPTDSLHHRPPPFQPQPASHHMMPHHHHPYSPHHVPGPELGPAPSMVGPPAPYSLPPRPPTQEGQPYTSPKTQRKAKGHVASACVPCKKAHLRCDAQRPCSRCISNGKEDSCIDVQHKKRGRPRLRDDRELRYDVPSRAGQPQEGGLRRPISLFSQPPSMGVPSYNDSLRRSQSYRVLKSQPSDGVASRFLERGSAADVNVYPAPLSIATRPPEAAAFLTMDFAIAKASATFSEALGRHAKGMRLAEVVVPGDQERVANLQSMVHDEQSRKEPNYLPPIFGKEEEERVIFGLGFSQEEMSRFNLDRQEYLSFSGPDGQPRLYPVRVGLAKQDSIYFVVLQLALAPRPHGHLTPSPHSRDPWDLPYLYQAAPQLYAPQPTPVAATFDPGRPRLGSDASVYGMRPQGGSQMMPGLSPGLPSAYAASPSRPEYSPGSAYQIPRSELPHFKQDLLPYVCISEDCAEPSVFFPSFFLWRNHMDEVHTVDWAQKIHNHKVWYCDLTPCKHEEFSKAEGLQQHITSKHPTVLAEAQISRKLTRSFLTPPREGNVCPLCEQNVLGLEAIQQQSVEAKDKGKETAKPTKLPKKARFQMPDGEFSSEEDTPTHPPSPSPAEPQGDNVTISNRQKVAMHVASHLKSIAFLSIRYIDDESAKVTSEATALGVDGIESEHDWHGGTSSISNGSLDFQDIPLDERLVYEEGSTVSRASGSRIPKLPFNIEAEVASSLDDMSEDELRSFAELHEDPENDDLT
ncbi:hypothetical protein RB600_001481 [Gaeumannomyces tritici]